MSLARWRAALRGKGRTLEPVLLAEAILLGITGALASQLFLYTIKKAEEGFLHLLADYRPPHLVTEAGSLTQHIGVHGLWWIPIATTLGGLVSGLLIAFVALESKGHGTDKAFKSFHHMAGFVRARVPLNTLVSASAIIGSGGSAGREGPIISISGGIGSVSATYLHRPEEERSLLLLIGMATGLSAIYRAPIGAAVFAVEGPYGSEDFESPALLYAMLGAVVAWIINALFVGWTPMFQMPHIIHPYFYQYGLFVVLGLAAGLISSVYPWFFYKVRDGFNALKVPLWMKPAIGGACVGLIAVAMPQILGGGYGWMQEAINGQLAVAILVPMIFIKVVGLSFTVGSGGTGGVFAPSLFIGGMLGGSLAHLFHEPVAPFVIIGMAAVFGTSCRVPLTALLMITEMTSAWQLFPAIALAVWVSYLLQVRLSHRMEHHSLYEEQVPTKAESPAHYTELIGNVLGILNKLPGRFSGEDVKAILQSNLEVDMTAGRKLAAIEVPPTLAGYSLAQVYDGIRPAELEILGVLRDQQLLLPMQQTKLCHRDRMLVIVSPEARKRLGRQLPLAA